MKSDIWAFWNCVEKIQVRLEYDKNDGCFTWSRMYSQSNRNQAARNLETRELAVTSRTAAIIIWVFHGVSVVRGNQRHQNICLI
jgi:nuclear transport factor 2 (NTF2) superfamily protein